MKLLTTLLVNLQYFLLFVMLILSSITVLPGYDSLDATSSVWPYIHSTDTVSVNAVPNTEWLMFSYNNLKNPVEDRSISNRTVLLYYPGGTVGHLAYAPTLNKMVEKSKGKLFILLMKIPFRAAIFWGFSPLFGLNYISDNNLVSSDLFQKIGYDKLNVTSYFIGGHSLGGVGPSMFPVLFPDIALEFKGIKLAGILYHASFQLLPFKNLKKLPILHIHASKDCVLRTKYLSTEFQKSHAPSENFKDFENIQENFEHSNSSKNLKKDFKKNLTEFFIIDGGNHEQFGFYGHQKGDCPADEGMDKWKQNQIIVDKSVAWINENA